MIQFELKRAKEPATKVNEDGSATVTIGFTTGVVGVPENYGMTCGDTIVISINNFLTKTGEQLNTEVMTAINNYITTNYPKIK